MVTSKKWKVLDADGNLYAHGVEFTPISRKRLIRELMNRYNIPFDKITERIKVETL